VLVLGRELERGGTADAGIVARLTDGVDVTSSGITSIGRLASLAAARRGSALARLRMPAKTRKP